MARIVIRFPDAKAAQIISDFCEAHHYQATIPDPDNPGQTIPNPETKPQFAKRMVARSFFEHVRSVRINRASKRARDLEDEKVKQEVDIT